VNRERSFSWRKGEKGLAGNQGKGKLHSREKAAFACGKLCQGNDEGFKEEDGGGQTRHSAAPHCRGRRVQ